LILGVIESELMFDIIPVHCKEYEITDPGERIVTARTRKDSAIRFYTTRTSERKRCSVQNIRYKRGS